jgi:hypothetical protein
MYAWGAAMGRPDPAIAEAGHTLLLNRRSGPHPILAKASPMTVWALVRVQVEFGWLPQQPNAQGQWPLGVARSHRDEALMEALVQHGAQAPGPHPTRLPRRRPTP